MKKKLIKGRPRNAQLHGCYLTLIILRWILIGTIHWGIAKESCMPQMYRVHKCKRPVAIIIRWAAHGPSQAKQTFKLAVEESFNTIL